MEQRVAITLWKLATNIEFRTVGQSTVGKIVIETAAMITTHLLPRFVQIPKGEQLNKIIDDFESERGFPQAVGVIDGTHIPIIRPEESFTDYYNRKGYYSVFMQAVVDCYGLFMEVYIGWPGRVHDARVFY